MKVCFNRESEEIRGFSLDASFYRTAKGWVDSDGDV